jgi:hypothetical protein
MGTVRHPPSPTQSFALREAAAAVKPICVETARPPAGLATQDEPDVSHLPLLLCGSDPQDGALVQEGSGQHVGWAVSLRWVSCFPRHRNFGVRASVTGRLMLGSHSPLLRGTVGKASAILDRLIALPGSGDTVHPDQ